MAESKISDKVLVKQFKAGSLAAFEELVHRYEAKVYNMALRFMRNQEDAEEVLQDVFSTLYLKIKGFKGKSAFSSWLYRVIMNASFMKLRKRKSQQTVSIEDLALATRMMFVERAPYHSHVAVQHSESIAIKHQLRAALEQSIEKLPDQYRAVFVLRDVDGLSNNEVGELLDLSVPAVKSRLHRSRLMLRKKLLRSFRDYMGRDPKPEEIGEEGEFNSYEVTEVSTERSVEVGA